MGRMGRLEDLVEGGSMGEGGMEDVVEGLEEMRVADKEDSPRIDYIDEEVNKDRIEEVVKGQVDAPPDDSQYCEWLCRSSSPPHLESSRLLLRLWTSGLVSGLRTKQEADPPGLLRQQRSSRRWETIGFTPVEEEGAWDVVGQWSRKSLLLRLVPRRGGEVVVLRGEWWEGGVRGVRLSTWEGRVRDDLELVQVEEVNKEDPELTKVRTAFQTIETYFTGQQLSGYHDLTITSSDGQEVRTNWMLVLGQSTSMSTYFRGLDRQEGRAARVTLPCTGLALTACLQFFSSGRLDLHLENVQELVELADYLGAEGLLIR